MCSSLSTESLSRREKLVQRAILTAVAEVKLVDDDYCVTDATLGSIIIAPLCTTSVACEGREVSAHLQLVLAKRAGLEYELIAGCIAERIAELDYLTGRPSVVKNDARLAVDSLSFAASVSVYVGGVAADTQVQPAEVSPNLLNGALGRSSVDSLLGVRDLRLASAEYRLHFLLRLGLEFSPWLDEPVCARQGDGELCAIEELDTLSGASARNGPDEPCCATGCEPCVWESYYRLQARQRRAAALKRKERSSLALEELAAGTGGGTEADAHVTEAAAAPLISVDEMVEVPLERKERATPDTFLFVFAAALEAPPAVPWHVRLQLPSLDGAPVTRPYTVLRCEGNRLELLVKLVPGGRCTSALAALEVGQTVRLRGPVVTDAALNALLCDGAAPRPLYCLSGGTGVAPMLQIADDLTRRAAALSGGEGGGGGGGGAVVRIWSVNRTLADVVVPSHMAASQLRARAAGLRLECTNVLTRLGSDEPLPADPCAPFGGEAEVRRGRPRLAALLEGLDDGERGAAVLVVCGPDSFNAAMRDEALALGFAEERVFLRDTPRDTDSTGAGRST